MQSKTRPFRPGTITFAARACTMALVVAVSGSVTTLGAVMASTEVVAQEPTYPTDPESLARGREIAESLCATCHAVGPEGDSPLAEAPHFRDLGKRYKISSLEESLAEGIVTGHNDMPEFSFETDDIEAFLGYLTSIQTP